jgi:hypothetical protein
VRPVCKWIKGPFQVAPPTIIKNISATLDFNDLCNAYFSGGMIHHSGSRIARSGRNLLRLLFNCLRSAFYLLRWQFFGSYDLCPEHLDFQRDFFF